MKCGQHSYPGLSCISLSIALRTLQPEGPAVTHPSSPASSITNGSTWTPVDKGMFDSCFDTRDYF